MKVVFHCCCRKIRIVPYVEFTDLEEPVILTPHLERPRPKKGWVIMGIPDLPISKQANLRPKFSDRKGNATKPDGVPEWSTDNTDVLALTPSPDGLSCKVKPVGPVSDSPVSVTVTADVDRSGATKTMIGVFVIDKVSAGDAVRVDIDADPLEDLEEEPTPP